VNRLTGQISAIKKMEVSPSNLTDLVQEITMLRELSGEYCIEYHNSYYRDGSLWVSMECMDAGSVGDLLERKKALSEPQIGCVLAQVLPALRWLHTEKGVVHRDIKAGNLLLNCTGCVKLGDFGICRRLDNANAKLQTQIGSPFWMSPELIIGEGYDQRADVWSLGITVLEMSEHNHPLFEKNPMTAMFQIVNQEAPSLTVPAQWSEGFRDFVARILVKDPEKRPTPDQLLEHEWLRQWVGKEREVLRELAAEYSKLLSTHGSNAAIRGESQTDVADNEGIVRFLMPDETHRSLLLRLSDTMDVAIERLCRKCMLDRTRNFTLYYLHRENERRVPDGTRPLQFVRQLPHNNPFLIFREEPDVESFTRLMDASSGLNLERSVLGKAQLPRFSRLTAVLLGPNLSVVPGLVSTASKQQQEELLQSLLQVFESQNQTVRLFTKLCSREVADSVRTGQVPSALFRGASVSGRLMSLYAKDVGGTYARLALRTSLLRVLRLAEPLELDTHRMRGSGNLKEDLLQLKNNLRQLQHLCEQFLCGIVDNVCELPLPVRQICRELQIIVTHRFRERRYIVPSSLLFLRFLCPALITPHQYGVLDEKEHVSPEARRTLILVSKTLQALASGTQFVQKEDHMRDMNPFVEEHRPALDHFFDLVMDVPSAVLPVPSGIKDIRLEGIRQLDSVQMRSLCAFISEHTGEIGRAMGALPPLIEDQAGALGLPPAQPTSRRSGSMSSFLGQKNRPGPPM
jgi:serine/threonine protein kinase